MVWVILALGLLGLGYIYFSKIFSYFRNHGVPEAPGYFPFGSSNNWKFMTGRLTFTQLTDEIYLKYPDAPIVGYYGSFGAPALLIRDQEIAKRMNIKDFDHFTDRRVMKMSKEENKYMVNMLFSLTGETWKAIRTIISPVFTSGRLKGMIPIMNRISAQLKEVTDEMAKEKQVVHLKRLFSDLSFEVIMSTGFGIEVNAWKDKENIVKKMARTYLGLEGGYGLAIKLMVVITMPWIAEKMKLRVFNGEAEDFLVNILKQSLEKRKKGDLAKRNDLVDLFIQALKDAEHENSKSSQNNASSILSKMSEDEKETMLISQALIMFLAAYDTTSNALSLTFHFLALNPDCQEKLLEEITSAIDDNDGNIELNYDQLQKLDYAQSCLDESMRMYSIVGATERVCVKDYYIPEVDYTVPKGMLVQLANVMKIDDFFPNAKDFNPNNFSKDAKQNRPSHWFSSFGYGPRNCIGMRFAYLEMKMVLVHMIYNFKVLECEKTPKELVPDPLDPTLLPKGGLWVTFEPRIEE